MIPIRTFNLVSKNSLQVKGSIIDNIILASSGKTAFINYAGNVLSTINIDAAKYDLEWDFRDFGGIYLILPIGIENLLFLSSRGEYGIFDIAANSFLWTYPDRLDRGKDRCCVSRKSDKLAVVIGNTLIIYSTIDGEELCSIPVTGGDERKVQFNPAANIITYMNYDTLSAYAIHSQEKIWEIPVSGGAGYDIWEFSQGGNLFGMCNLDQASRICDSKTGKTNVFLRKGNDEKVNGIHFFENDTKVITCSFDGSARIWDVASGKMLHDFKDHKDNGVDSVITTADAMCAISFTQWDNTFYLWDAVNGGLMDKISFDFTVHTYQLVDNGSTSRTLVVVGINEYRMDSTINSQDKKPPQIHICKVQF